MRNHFLFLFLLLLFLTLFSPSSSRSEPFALRISCGARTSIQTPATKTLWFKDFGYTGGRPTNATATPSTISPPLETLRYFPLSDGPENCYNINRVPNGHYSVRIFFGLVQDSTIDTEPLFDVSVEGTQIYTLKSGWTAEEDQSFTEALVFVTDGSVSICFHSTGHGDPSILSIEILQVDAKSYDFGPGWGEGVVLRTAARLNCGSRRPAFDEDYGGDHWGGDRFWKGIESFGENGDEIVEMDRRRKIKKAGVRPNFYPEKIYETALVSTDSQQDLMYTVEVDPNRNYSIWLHFAEIDRRIGGVNERVFDVLINGDIAFRDVDVARMSGDRYTALVLNKTVEVNGRSLSIILHPTKGDHAIINAIEIFEIIAAEAKTAVEEVRALQTLKRALELPLRFGWNGDPCVPQQHPWGGVDCQYNRISHRWVIDGLGLDNQGLRGFLPKDISKLRHLQNINLSGNSIRGAIPSSLGTITPLETLDLSFNLFNGSIPESLGLLTFLRRLNLNSNFLSGRVPATLGARLLHRVSSNFTANAGLCGIPGLPTCSPHLSTSAKIGIAFGVFFALLLIIIFSVCWWKRRQNILRSQRIAASREAPYAKARTHYVRDVQLARHHGQENTRTATENGPNLLS